MLSLHRAVDKFCLREAIAQSIGTSGTEAVCPSKIQSSKPLGHGRGRVVVDSPGAFYLALKNSNWNRRRIYRTSRHDVCLIVNTNLTDRGVEVAPCKYDCYV